MPIVGGREVTQEEFRAKVEAVEASLARLAAREGKTLAQWKADEVVRLDALKEAAGRGSAASRGA